MDARDRGAGVYVARQDAERDGRRKAFTAKDAKSAKSAKTGGKLGDGMDGVTDVDIKIQACLTLLAYLAVEAVRRGEE